MSGDRNISSDHVISGHLYYHRRKIKSILHCPKFHLKEKKNLKMKEREQFAERLGLNILYLHQQIII